MREKACRNIALIFPPGWSLTVGSPHLALPLLAARLKKAGFNMFMRDCNWEIARYLGVEISAEHVRRSCSQFRLKEMNEPYFAAEDKLMRIAREFDGKWNIQLGFRSSRFSHSSSADVLEASGEKYPFSEYYRTVILPWIETIKPGLIGMSIASVYQLIPAFYLSKLLRENGYNGIIVMGGNTISRLKNGIKNCSLFNLVDAFVIFQGEIPLLLLAEAIEKGESFDNIPSIIWRNGSSDIKVNPLLNEQDLNSLPAPDFDGLPIGQYWGVNYLPLIAARGCYHGKCSFCPIPYGWGNNGFAGTRNVAMVHQDMIDLSEKYGMQRFKFMDESFLPPLLKSLSKLILQNGSNFEWEAYVRLEKQWLDKNFVGLLAKAGFKKAYFGLEFYPTNSRDKLNKRDQGDAVLTILRNCYDNGIKTHLFCLFGYPGTGETEAKRTIDFIIEHKNVIDTVDINPFVYSKHTFVPDIKQIVDTRKDWALEYDYEPENKNILSKEQVETLTYELEEILWNECPRMLHPTYRLITPWGS